MAVHPTRAGSQSGGPHKWGMRGMLACTCEQPVPRAESPRGLPQSETPAPCGTGALPFVLSPQVPASAVEAGLARSPCCKLCQKRTVPPRQGLQAIRHPSLMRRPCQAIRNLGRRLPIRHAPRHRLALREDLSRDEKYLSQGARDPGYVGTKKSPRLHWNRGFPFVAVSPGRWLGSRSKSRSFPVHRKLCQKRTVPLNSDLERSGHQLPTR